MESRVLFQDGMDNDPADYNNLQDFAQGGVDHVVADGITDERKFAGFAAAQSGTAEVTVLPGRLYSGGLRYARNDAYVIDFSTKLPVATKKIAVVTVWGGEIDTDARPREFLINEETGASEPRTVTMERARIANMGVAYGTESPDPTAPLLDVGLLAIAQIVLTPTGVLSVTMLSDNALVSGRSLNERLKVQETFSATAAPQIVSLGSDLANIRQTILGNTSIGTTADILTRLAVVEAKSDIPAAAAASGADFFLGTDKSDTTNLNYSAAIRDGATFADNNANVTSLAIFDSLNPAARIANGVMLPAWQRSQRLSVGPKTGEVQISSFSYQTNTMVQKTVTRQRLRYGETYQTVPYANVYWYSGGYNVGGGGPAGIFSYNGETMSSWTWPGIYYANAFVTVREPYYWYDTVEETYWDKVTVDHSVPGAQIAETFLNANDMWLASVGLYFTKIAASGNIVVSICEVDNGAPNLTKVIAHQAVDRSQLNLNTETIINIQPTFLEGGKRYAIVLTTAADHWAATTAGENFAQGTFFYVLDGAYQQGDGTRDLMFNLYAAKFTASRAVINLSPLSLAGGILGIDILAETVQPKSTSLTYEIQVGDGTWYPLNRTALSVLGTVGNQPPLVQLRAVFTGTPDVMPSVKLSGSQVTVNAPKTTMTHISTARTLGASSTQIRVIEKLVGFDSVHHTATCKLLTGGSYATSTSPNSYSDVTNADGSTDRTYVFNLGAGVTSYKIRSEGTTDTARKIFSIGLRKDYAL